MNFNNLPTNKPHISFSEAKVWKECGWRHRLRYIKNIDLDKPSAALTFGTAQHAAIENLLTTGDSQLESHIEFLRTQWTENPDFEKSDPIEKVVLQLKTITSEFIPFLNETFPGWKHEHSEFLLYEQISDKPHAFKGFIDLIISVPHKNKRKYWILDLKTTTWGWTSEKKSDESMRSQLLLYKHFWCTKQNIPLNDVLCGFILLKRTVEKQNKRCELVKVSSGDISIGRSLKVVSNMLYAVNNNKVFKNFDSCRWCPYRGSEPNWSVWSNCKTHD
jgi:hypothetical protein